LFDPVPLGIYGGTVVGALQNLYRARPPLSSEYIFLKKIFEERVIIKRFFFINTK